MARRRGIVHLVRLGKQVQSRQADRGPEQVTRPAVEAVGVLRLHDGVVVHGEAAGMSPAAVIISRTVS
jgi:hypothetical protein